jgi:hypothetical protein
MSPVGEFVECAKLITVGKIPLTTGRSVYKVIVVEETKAQTETRQRGIVFHILGLIDYYGSPA